MSATTHTSVSTATAWTRRLHYTGSGLLATIGLAHLLIVHLFAPALPAAEQRVADLSASVGSPLIPGGMARTVLELNTGYSIGTGALLLCFGLAAAGAVRQVPQLATHRSSFTVTCLLTAVVVLTIAVVSFPEPPIALAGLSALSYGAALLMAGSARTTPKPDRMAR